MAYRSKSKYEKQRDSMLSVETMFVLADAEKPLNIDEIKASNMMLAGTSSQKMARVLNELIDIGAAQKHQDKKSGRMVYETRITRASIFEDEDDNEDEIPVIEI